MNKNRYRYSSFTLLMGAVNKLGNNSIQTQFLHPLLLMIPLIPQRTYYFLDDVTTWRSYWQGRDCIEIPVHRKSVQAAYLRFYSSVVASALWIFAGIVMIDKPMLRYASWDIVVLLVTVLVGALVATVLAVYGLTRFGRLSPVEQQQRRVLRLVTGLGLTPDELYLGQRARIYEQLTLRWLNTLPKQEPYADNWRAVFAETDITKLGHHDLLYALSRYHDEEQFASHLWSQSDVFPKNASLVS